MAKLGDAEMVKLVRTAWRNFEGDAGVFMSAVGALVLGREVGWQAVRVTMSATTYRKYERVFGKDFRFRDYLEERTPEAKRVKGMRIVDKVGKFWQALSGGLVPALEGKIVEAK